MKIISTSAWLVCVILCFIHVANQELVNTTFLALGLTACFVAILTSALGSRKRNLKTDESFTSYSSANSKRLRKLCSSYFFIINRSFWTLFIVMMLCHFTIGAPGWLLITTLFFLGILIGSVLSYKCFAYLYNGDHAE